MSVSIIDEAPKRYVAQCAKCGCRFSYEISDVHSHMMRNDGVSCPQCGDHCIHHDQRSSLAGR